MWNRKSEQDNEGKKQGNSKLFIMRMREMEAELIQLILIKQYINLINHLLRCNLAKQSSTTGKVAGSIHGGEWSLKHRLG